MLPPPPRASVRKPVGLELSARSPECLVGLGFRCWFAGYQTGDIACWELAWTRYEAWLGPTGAKTAVGELASWVRSVREAAQRDIAVFPSGCATFCADECLAISLIAAGQHGACPAMQACALALLGCSATDRVMESSQCFASVLMGLDQNLSPDIVAQPLRH